MDGEVYDGDWVNDMANGKGSYSRNGFLYEGEWKDDLYNG
jgi:hypothetical protein